MSQPSHTRRADQRGGVAVVLTVGEHHEHLKTCLDSLARHTPASTPVVQVGASTAELNRALERLEPADVVILLEPCRVTAGWLERLRVAAGEDSNTATLSALADVGGELALLDGDEPAVELESLAEELAANTLRLRPRISTAVGPCVYVRRAALELVGMLDEELELVWGLELDFALRCLRCGLAHLAADDVVVQRLSAPRADTAHREIPARLRERFPQISSELAPRLAESSVLIRALELARPRRGGLSVTLDARALDGAITGTQVHILELIVALARIGELRLRLLVWSERIDSETLQLLRGLPATEILAVEDIGAHTPKSTVFHRPQQAFSAGDVALALTLGERVVLSQLDMIAYRNPAYFEDTESWEDYRRASRHGLCAAERVIVFSEHTRRELLADALVEDARVRVIPPGLDHRPPVGSRRPPGMGEPVAPASTDFLLCLGTDFAHKNRLFALRMFAALHGEQGWRGRLVFAGTHIAHGSSRERERAFLEKHPQLSEAVIELGSVGEDERLWLLRHATALVYPSVYEGFGLVPFESALSGVPCIFAAQSSLAEAAPPGTATIVPWDAAQSAAAAHELLVDGAVRGAHLTALTAAARRLTWDATAAATVELYREAAVAPVRDAATLSRDAHARERSLTASHATVVRTLIDEREQVLRDYNELIEELGPGRSLIGAHGALPEDLQRALLALSALPSSRPLYGALARTFALARTAFRALRGGRRRRS